MDVEPLVKPKRIRLKGKAIEKLNREIHERDVYKCVVCGKYVPIGEKWHHEKMGSNKEDVIEAGCLLCYECHQYRHGKDGERTKMRCELYLQRLYPEYWGVGE